MALLTWSIQFGVSIPPPVPVPPTVSLWTQMADELVDHVPDAPHFTLLTVLQRAAQEFYRDSRCWRQDITFTAVAAQSAYTIGAIDPETEMIAMVRARQDKQELQVLETDASQALDDDPEVAIGVSGPTTVRMVPAPTTGGTVRASVALMPADAATGVAHPRFREHRDGIMALALWRLYLQRGKPWADPRMAGYWRGEAERAMAYHAAMAGPSRPSGGRRLRVRPSPV